MPDDLSPRSFATKTVNYGKKVVDIPNSMTILADLLPVSLVMSEERGLTGVYNFCNPGAISTQ
jgi:3,5-epimerase/4-reductase